MTTEKQLAALITAGADPVLISKFQQFPPAPKKAEPAEPIVEEVAPKERRGRRKGL